MESFVQVLLNCICDAASTRNLSYNNFLDYRDAALTEKIFKALHIYSMLKPTLTTCHFNSLF